MTYKIDKIIGGPLSYQFMILPPFITIIKKTPKNWQQIPESYLFDFDFS